MSPHLGWFDRLMFLFAGLLGVGGIFAAAASSHAGNDRVYAAAALIALTQAPAMLVFGLVSPAGRLLRVAAIAIGTGACLFSGVVAGRQLFDSVILPMAAPAGATATVVGWTLIAIAGLVGRR